MQTVLLETKISPVDAAVLELHYQLTAGVHPGLVGLSDVRVLGCGRWLLPL
jgi:hypothetical protein